MNFEVSCIQVDRFISKKGTACAWVWVSFKGMPMPYKILCYDADKISKAETACNQKSPLICKIGSGSDLVARVEVA